MRENTASNFSVFPIARLLVACLAIFASACSLVPLEEPGETRFGERQDGGEVKADHLIEISGAAASRRNPNVLWVHNDSGDSNRIYAIDRQGNFLGEVWLEGCDARDWEDMAAGLGENDATPYLYVGDIGDNLGVWRERRVCRIVEPVIDPSTRGVSIRVQADVLRIRFSDRPRDAEALLVDPITHDLYIVTKRESEVLLYRIAHPQPFGGVVEVAPEGTLPLSGICAGDVSPDGAEVLLKTLSGVYYWRRAPGETLLETLRSPARRVPYVREPQGEAVAWESTGGGYFTLSEKVLALRPHVYFYPRTVPLSPLNH